MKNIVLKIIGITFIIISTLGNLDSQTLQASLLDNVNESMRMAKHSQTDVLYPRTFEEAMGRLQSKKKKIK